MPARSTHPIFARVFTALVASPLGKGMDKDRRRLVAGLRGRVIEVGAGTGANFAQYPPEVTEVVAVEPEAFLRSKAEAAAARAPVPVRVVDGDAGALAFPNESFDAVVFSLVLCTVPSVEAALAEAFRVLRSGGEVRFYEHVVAPEGGLLARVQRALDSTVWPRFTGGCHTARDPVAALAEAGFTLESTHRKRLAPLGLPTPITPHVAGLARKP